MGCDVSQRKSGGPHPHKYVASRLHDCVGGQQQRKCAPVGWLNGGCEPPQDNLRLYDPAAPGRIEHYLIGACFTAGAEGRAFAQRTQATEQIPPSHRTGVGLRGC